MDLCVMVRSEFGEGKRHSEFFMLPLVVGRSGNQAAQQAFVRLRHSGGELADVAGLELALSFVDFVPPEGRRSPPVDQQHVGAIDTLTEQQLAKRIIQLAWPGGGAKSCTLHRVVIQSMRYRDVDLAHIVVDGEGDLRHCVEFGTIAKPRPSKGPNLAPRKRDMCSDLLDEDAASARRARAGRQGRVVAPASEPQSAPEVCAADVREAMRELGLAEQEISIEDFCQFEGLLSAVFSALPAHEKAAMVAAEVEARASGHSGGGGVGASGSEDDDQHDASSMSIAESDGSAASGADIVSGTASGSADVAPPPVVEWPWTVLEVAGLLRYMDKANGRFAGALHWMGNNSLKATCGIKEHGKCGCWVTVRGESPDVRALEDKLTEWIAYGCSDSKEAHAERSVNLRVGFGMRVRRR